MSHDKKENPTNPFFNMEKDKIKSMIVNSMCGDSSPDVYINRIKRIAQSAANTEKETKKGG